MIHADLGREKYLADTWISSSGTTCQAALLDHAAWANIKSGSTTGGQIKGAGENNQRMKKTSLKQY